MGIKDMVAEQNMLAADCIVICCCCQCLILQTLVVILLKLPHKLLRKMKEYAKKFKTRRRAGKVMLVEIMRYEHDSFGSLGNSCRIDGNDLRSVESLRFDSMDEIESVLEELSSKGEFAFGSFWGGEASASCSLRSCPEEINYDDIGFLLMELFGSAVVCYQ